MRWVLIVLASISLASAAENAVSAADYKAFLEGLDQTDVESFSKASDYFRDNMAHAPVEACDEAARAFIVFFEAAVSKMKGFDNMPKVASYVQRDSGVEIGGTLDGWSCRVREDAAATLFAPFIARSSPEIADYLALPPLPLMFWGEFGGSRVSFHMLAEHVGARERFLQRYPESPYAAEVARLLMIFRYCFFVDDYIDAFGRKGDGNRRGELHAAALDAYRWYLRAYPETPTAANLRAYLEILQESDYRFDPSVYAFLESCDTDPERDWLPGEYNVAEDYLLRYEGTVLDPGLEGEQASSHAMVLSFSVWANAAHESRRDTP